MPYRACSSRRIVILRSSRNIDHDPTANQITQLRSGNYTWNLKVTESDGTISFLPADEAGGIETAFGTLLVFDNLATS